jgi:hypothetical protein
MISIIVSTYKPEYFARFKDNIEANIGVDYEIVPIENKGVMGLCEAYNLGAELAKYPYLCFCHEDILINTEKWGEKIIKLFLQNDNWGLLGVAGSTYQAFVPSPFFSPYENRFTKIDMYQADFSLDHIKRSLDNPPAEGLIEEVVTLDGCWLFTTAKIAQEFKFDETTLKGFHCYDLDYSLQVGSKYKVGVVFGLELIHLSSGSYQRDWVVETFKFYKKWKKKLPLTTAKPIPSYQEMSDYEFNVFNFTLDRIDKYNTCVYEMFKFLYSFRFIKLVGLKKWFKLNIWTWGVVFRHL